MANPQPDKFTKLSNELYEAIMKTDFSKRQRNILDLIIRLSYGCGKKFAILRPSDFEVVGILRGHVKKELEYLQATNVLLISGENYTLNKDYDTWRVSLTKSFNEEKFQRILARNLSNFVTETVTNVTEMVTGEVTETVTFVTEMVTPENEELPKQEQDSYQNSNTPVTKTVTGTPDEPSQDAGSRVPKESIKESIKESSTSNRVTACLPGNDERPPADAAPDYSFQRLYVIFLNHFASDPKKAALESEIFQSLYDDYEGEWLYAAMREAAKYKSYSLPYVEKVLRGYKARGGPTKEQPAARIEAAIVDDDDPITRMMREEDQRALGAAK